MWRGPMQSRLATAWPRALSGMRMPRFYFHLHNDVDVSDEGGEEMPDLEAALAHAIRMVRFEVAEGALRDGRIVLSHRIDIEDGNGTVMATVHFRDAVEVAQ